MSTRSFRDESSFVIGAGNVGNLGHTTSAYHSDPNNRTDVPGRMTRTAAAPPEFAPRDRSNIIAILMNRDFVEAARFRPGAPVEVIWRPFVEDLVSVLAFHREGIIIDLANEGDLRSLGLTVDEAWTLAMSNLPARIGALHAEQLETGVFSVSSDSRLASSHLMEPDFCALPQRAQRIFLVFSGRSYMDFDRAKLRALAYYVDIARVQRRPMWDTSATPLECRNGAVVQSDVLQTRQLNVQ
jgi:hypothetical protein